MTNTLRYCIGAGILISMLALYQGQSRNSSYEDYLWDKEVQRILDESARFLEASDDYLGFEP